MSIICKSWHLWWPIKCALEEKDTEISWGGFLVTLSWTSSVFDNPSTLLQSHYSRSGHWWLWNLYLPLFSLPCLHLRSLGWKSMWNMEYLKSGVEDWIIDYGKRERAIFVHPVNLCGVSTWVLFTTLCWYHTEPSGALLLFLFFLECWKTWCFQNCCCAIEHTDILPNRKKEKSALQTG